MVGTYPLSCFTCLLVVHVFYDTIKEYDEYARKAISGEYSSWVESALNAEKGLPSGLCPESPGICPASKYRDLRGLCNNVRYPTSGSMGTTFSRLMSSSYKDGLALPKRSTDTHFLPGADDVVKAVKSKRYHQFVTPMVGLWGEFISNDIASTANPEINDCCGIDSQHPECFPFYAGGQCHPYSRSLPALSNCAFKQREQMNMVTAYLDGSALYGSENDLNNFRLYKQGQVVLRNCHRCNHEGVLSSLYKALLNHHNKIALDLSMQNPHWDDETLFQETKKIVVAEIQHVTYREFLPVVLGEEAVDMNNMKPETQVFYDGYSSQTQVKTINEVATSILPIFQTMYIDQWASDNNGTKLPATHVISKILSIPAIMPSIPVVDLHRSRDHGIVDYVTANKFCSKQNGTHIAKLESADKLKKLYRYETDVDLSIGGLLEIPLPGALVGPTFACLLIEQFKNLRRGDRFWYENDLPPSSFTSAQLESIKRVTLSGILCSGLSSLDYIQSDALLQKDSYLNSEIACSLQPALDLTPWKHEKKNDIPHDMLMQIVRKAEVDVSARQKEEYLRWSINGGADPKSPVGIAAAFNKATKEALNMANSSLFYEFTTEELLQSLGRQVVRRKRQLFDTTGSDNFLRFFPNGFDNGGNFIDSFQDVDLTGIMPQLQAFEPECPNRDGPEICDELTPFRTHSGYCNNLKNPHLGKSLATFARLLPAMYENGVSKPKSIGVNGDPLPSPRLVSTMIHADISNLHNRYSLMLMQFSQFLDHDVTFTPVHKGFFASIPDCRSCDSAFTIHPECMPIPIPHGDPHYPQINETNGAPICLAFMRSLPGQQYLGPREQINQNSAFIDAAHIYGEHQCQGNELRSGFGGRMNVTRHPSGKDLLPQSPIHPECKSPSGYCFIAGDGRASEQPGLTTIHTVFMREHNRIAEGLARVNPHWDDNLLYEHARRIVTGVWQHLIYNEYLPRLLGWNAVNLYGLKLRPQGYYKGYSDSCNPNILNEFATAAFRIGHSLLRPHIPRMGPSYTPVDPPILLRNGFFNPDMIYQAKMIDEIVRGLITTPVETLDQFITGEITNHLFEDRRIPFSGIDLAALNIQRGRDHALRGYNDYRAVCNLKRATTFEDLAREIPHEVIVRLKAIYASVDDIDLFPGGMSERPVQGGIVGPTFACIIGIQFRQLRKCDRFWYETDNPVTKFTEQQLHEIRKMTLSKVLCENMDHPEDIQRSAFDQPSNFLNPKVPCHSIPDVNLGAWRDVVHGCVVNGRKISVGSSTVSTPCTSCTCTPQGTQCASLRVADCNQLVKDWTREAVLLDDVCTAQCGFLLQENEQFSRGLNPPPPPPDSSFNSNAISLSRRPVRGRKLIPVDLIPPPPRPPRPIRRNRLPLYTDFKISTFFKR
ncbi:hypothetical protein RUM44_011227 [Polyplax serrata]|uniref:Peroxidase n=1 Tax=Polyplax serrata TaxID=468196 RepID=A0ABR1APF4_POLSC